MSDDFTTRQMSRFIENIDITISDLRLIKHIYQKFQELDTTKQCQRLEDQVKQLREHEYKYLKTITERDLEIARLGLALGEALKKMPTMGYGGENGWPRPLMGDQK